MYSAWINSVILGIVSNIAGVGLVPVMDVEIGTINVSVKEDADNLSKRTTDQDTHDFPVTKWHYDSYPFVCIVMLSDSSKMTGGETAIRTGSGEISKARGPQMGCAVAMQGRCISHQALAAIGGTERLTMVTPFRLRDPLARDDSVLTTIRPITDLSDLYYQWTKYRAAVLKERLRLMLEFLEEAHKAGKPTDAARIQGALKDLEAWLEATRSEIVLDEDGGYRD